MIEDTNDNMPIRSHSVGLSLSRGIWTYIPRPIPMKGNLDVLEKTFEPSECGRPWSTGNFAGSKEWRLSRTFGGMVHYPIGLAFGASEKDRKITYEEMTRVKMKAALDLEGVGNIDNTGKDSYWRL